MFIRYPVMNAIPLSPAATFLFWKPRKNVDRQAEPPATNT